MNICKIYNTLFARFNTISYLLFPLTNLNAQSTIETQNDARLQSVVKPGKLVDWPILYRQINFKTCNNSQKKFESYVHLNDTGQKFWFLQPTCFYIYVLIFWTGLETSTFSSVGHLVILFPERCKLRRYAVSWKMNEVLAVLQRVFRKVVPVKMNI